MRAFKLYSLSNFQIYNTVLLTVNTDFPSGSAGKESTCNVGDTGDLGLIPRSRRFPGGGHGNPLQYSCQENPMDRGDWWATVHGVTKNRTQLKWLSLAHHSLESLCRILYTQNLFILKQGICTFWPPSLILPTSTPSLWQIAISSLCLWVGFYFLCFFFPFKIWVIVFLLIYFG